MFNGDGVVHLPHASEDLWVFGSPVRGIYTMCMRTKNSNFIVRKGEMPTCLDCKYEIEVDRWYASEGY